MGIALTVGTLNASLDITPLQYLFRQDMLESVSDLYQEMGRVGRRSNTNPSTNVVDLLVTSREYCFLLKQGRYQYVKSKLPLKKWQKERI